MRLLILITIEVAYPEVNGDLASKAAVAVLLGNGAPNPAKGCPIRVDNIKLPVHLALILDGVLNLRVSQDLIIQAGAIGMHLLHRHSKITPNSSCVACNGVDAMLQVNCFTAGNGGLE